MQLELHTSDGAIFKIKFNDEIANASGLTYNGRNFFFRYLQNGKIIFEEGIIIQIFEDEVTKLPTNTYWHEL